MNEALNRGEAKLIQANLRSSLKSHLLRMLPASSSLALICVSPFNLRYTAASRAAAFSGKKKNYTRNLIQIQFISHKSKARALLLPAPKEKDVCV